MKENKIIFALRLKKMAEALTTHITKILAQQNIEFKPRAVYILLILNWGEPKTISETASLLGITHPAVVQLVHSLIKLELIEQSKSGKDKRKTFIQLTKKGEDAIKSIEPVLVEINNSIESMLNEIDPGLNYSLLRLEESVGKKVLLTNVHSKMREKEIKEVRIVPFHKKYKDDFLQLNTEWLQKYFEIEKEDRRILINPEKEIIKKGGEVFFALLNEEVVGTCAVLKVDDATFELTKMAVVEKAQGKQIGKKLALTIIGFAVDKGATKIILSTSTKLVAASNLYKKLGFIEVDKADHRYERELIHMELDLIEQ
ncbi:MAG: bifunctional helix-turn-helix transcriptional regulator/GNAT family N-acetyltransferase [Ignavibacterium sp.]|nr:MAG: bifunctional helix-turn-helix transcriptional regulator/GNAT family N-acetyltransferase [Ignavibacterium sp.]